MWCAAAVVLAAGCAAPRSAVAPVATDGGTPSDIAAIAGVWEGQVWERPIHYLQGVRRITLSIARDGRWTASSGGAPCASGTVSILGDLVVLGGERVGPDFCMPYSIAARNGRMRAAFETSFKARPTTAMIGLELVRPATPAVAAAPARP